MFEFDGILLEPCLLQPCVHVAGNYKAYKKANELFVSSNISICMCIYIYIYIIVNKRLCIYVYIYIYTYYVIVIVNSNLV